jgi:hypothetical protein
MTKYDELIKYSTPSRVYKNAKEYFGKDVKIYISNKPTKKYMLQDPTGKWVHFGQMGFQDFTKHMDKERQYRYLKRAMGIKGDWYKNPYSPNMLAVNLLWL